MLQLTLSAAHSYKSSIDHQLIHQSTDDHAEKWMGENGDRVAK